MRKFSVRGNLIIILSALLIMIIGIIIGSIVSTSRQNNTPAVSQGTNIVRNKTTNLHSESAYEKFNHVPDFGKLSDIPLYRTMWKSKIYTYIYEAKHVTRYDIESYIDVLEKWGYVQIHSEGDDESYSLMYENNLGQKVGMYATTSNEELVSIMIDTVY